MIDAHRHRRIPYEVARQAVDAASQTQRGRDSNFEAALKWAAFAYDLWEFADEFAQQAVSYRETPFTLRAGGESHWYVDTRAGLARGSMLATAGRLMVASTERRKVRRDVTAGIGVAGRALVSTIGIHDETTLMCWGDDALDAGERYPRGLYGARVCSEVVWVVNDIASTGDSLVTLINMIREEGGEVEQADVLTDRSNGRAAETLSKMWVAFHALLTFDETTGALVPSGSRQS